MGDGLIITYCWGDLPQVKVISMATSHKFNQIIIIPKWDLHLIMFKACNLRGTSQVINGFI